MSKRNPMRTL